MALLTLTQKPQTAASDTVSQKPLEKTATRTLAIVRTPTRVKMRAPRQRPIQPRVVDGCVHSSRLQPQRDISLPVKINYKIPRPSKPIQTDRFLLKIATRPLIKNVVVYETNSETDQHLLHQLTISTTDISKLIEQQNVPETISVLAVPAIKAYQKPGIYPAKPGKT